MKDYNFNADKEEQEETPTVRFIGGVIIVLSSFTLGILGLLIAGV